MATLRLFAALREAAGVAQAQVEAGSAAEVIHKAEVMFGPDFTAQVQRASVAVNGREVSRQQLHGIRVTSADEIALLPPVSGGSRT